MKKTGTSRNLVSLKTKEIQTTLASSAVVEVINLDYSINQLDIKEIFTKCGKVRKVVLNYDENGKSRGTAVVSFHRIKDAMIAVEQFDRALVDGRPMHLKLLAKVVKKEVSKSAKKKPKVSKRKVTKVSQKKMPKKVSQKKSKKVSKKKPRVLKKQNQNGNSSRRKNSRRYNNKKITNGKRSNGKRSNGKRSNGKKSNGKRVTNGNKLHVLKKKSQKKRRAESVRRPLVVKKKKKLVVVPKNKRNRSKSRGRNSWRN